MLPGSCWSENKNPEATLWTTFPARLSSQLLSLSIVLMTLGQTPDVLILVRRCSDVLQELTIDDTGLDLI